MNLSVCEEVVIKQRSLRGRYLTTVCKSLITEKQDMVNAFLYSGLGVLLVASIIALFAAVKGYIYSKGVPVYDIQARQAVNTKIRKYTRPAFILFIIGFIIIGVGLALGLN